MIPIRSLCFHCDIAPLRFPPTTWRLRQIEAITKSTEPFPVNFDEAWVWIGYSTKGNAKRALEAVFKEGTDYRSFISSDKRAIGGTTKEVIHLTTNCFKKFCMMAGTEAGEAVRNYYLECERELKQFKSLHPARAQSPDR